MEALLLQTRRAPAQHHNAKIQTFLSSSFFIQLIPSEMEVLKKGSFYMHLQGPHYSCRNTASIQLKTTLERRNESIKQVIMNERSTQNLLCVPRLWLCGWCGTGRFTDPPWTAVEFWHFCLQDGRSRSQTQTWHLSIYGGGKTRCREDADSPRSSLETVNRLQFRFLPCSLAWIPIVRKRRGCLD